MDPVRWYDPAVSILRKKVWLHCSSTGPPVLGSLPDGSCCLIDVTMTHQIPKNSHLKIVEHFSSGFKRQRVFDSATPRFGDTFAQTSCGVGSFVSMRRYTAARQMCVIMHILFSWACRVVGTHMLCCHAPAALQKIRQSCYWPSCAQRERYRSLSTPQHKSSTGAHPPHGDGVTLGATWRRIDGGRGGQVRPPVRESWWPREAEAPRWGRCGLAEP